MRIHRPALVVVLLAIAAVSPAQSGAGADFYGNLVDKKGLCEKSSGFMAEQDVERLIAEMLAKQGLQNRFIVVECRSVANCLATVDPNKRPVILYNPDFLQRVKKLQFTESDLPAIDDRDWTSLTILAHEIGHHLNQHLTNPLPDATQRSMEIEADQTAGFLLYLMRGSLDKGKLAYDDVPVGGGYNYPPRSQRVEALEAGFTRAARTFPEIVRNDRAFGSGVKPFLSKVPFHAPISQVLAYELGPGQSNALSYERLATADECKNQEIKYYWRYLRESKIGEDLTAYLNSKGLKDKISKDSYILYFFKDNRLIRICYRLVAQSPDFLPSFLGSLGIDFTKHPKQYKTEIDGQYFISTSSADNLSMEIMMTSEAGFKACSSDWWYK